MVPTATDILTAEIAKRSLRMTEADVAQCLDRQAQWAREGRVVPLGQLLLKERHLRAEEFVEIVKRLEEPLFRCPACAKTHSARALDAAKWPARPAPSLASPEERELPVPPPGARPCPSCAQPIEPEAALRALDPAALTLCTGPLAQREESRTFIAQLLNGGDVKGRRFGRYEILDTLGIGGMGVVYRARQRDLERIVALKVLREGEGAREEQVRRFIHEARAAAKLQHPNIVAIHEVGVEQGIHYFTMDFVEGETLDQRLKRGERGDPRESARLIATVARAVHYAHERGIVHRDLKPGNILITPDGVPKITDFGLAKQLGEGGLLITRSGVAVGTPVYMSPEQAQGDVHAVDGRSDVFSLGILFYQLLTQKLPFTGESHLDVYNKILLEDPARPRSIAPAVPKDLETICLGALEKHPGDRYQSALDLAVDLERTLRGEPIRARALGPLERGLRAVKRHRTVALVAATALLMGGIGWALFVGALARERASARARDEAQAALEARRLLGDVEMAEKEGREQEVLLRAAVLHARAPDSEESIEARFLEGGALLALGRPREALASYARVYRTAREPRRRIEALSAMARAFLAERDYDHAIASLSKVVARIERGGPEAASATAYAELELGKIYAELQEWIEARKHLEAAQASATEAHRLSGSAGGRGASSEALDWLSWIDALAPTVELGGAEACATGNIDGSGRQVLLLIRKGVLVALVPGPEGFAEVARAPVVGPRDAVLDLATGDVLGSGTAQAVVVYRDAQTGPSLAVCALAAGHPSSFNVVLRMRIDQAIARGGLSVVDVDGDGRDDVVLSFAGERGRPSGVEVLRSTREPAAQAAEAPLLFQPIPIQGLGSTRGVTPALCAVDVDGDQHAELCVANAGPDGDDLRILRWNPGAGGLDVAWRRRTGAVAALVAGDVEGRGELDLVFARRRPLEGPAEDPRVGPGLHTLRPAEPGRGFTIAESVALGETRVRGLAAGDILARGASALVALLETAPAAVPGARDDPLVRIVSVFTGFGEGGAEPGSIRRRNLVFRDRAVEWIRVADLDSDGDAELIVGGPSSVIVYGLRAR